MANSTSVGSTMADSTSDGFTAADPTFAGSTIANSISSGSIIPDTILLGSTIADSTSLGSTTADSNSFGSTIMGPFSDSPLTPEDHGAVEGTTQSWVPVQTITSLPVHGSSDHTDICNCTVSDPASGQRSNDTDLFISNVTDPILGRRSNDSDLFVSDVTDPILGQRSNLTVLLTSTVADTAFGRTPNDSDLCNCTVTDPAPGPTLNDSDLLGFTDSVTHAVTAMVPEDDAMLSAEVYAQAVDVMQKLMYALQVAGLLLNIINIMVLTRRRLRGTTTTLLVSVSVVQLLYIVIRGTEDIYSIFCPPSLTSQLHLIYGIYIHNYCLTCLRRSLLGMQGLVSMERLLAVAYPLRAKQFLLVRRPLAFVMVTLVVIFAVHVHICFKLEIFKDEVGPGNGTPYSYRYTEAYLRHSKSFDTAGIVIKCVFVYLALLVLLVANVALLVVLRRHTGMMIKMQLSGVNTPPKRDNQMTFTILVATFIFIVLSLPTVSNSLAYNAVPDGYGPFTEQRHLFMFVQAFGGLCFMLSFSTDFLTYMALSSAYRNTLLRKCCRE